MFKKLSDIFSKDGYTGSSPSKSRRATLELFDFLDLVKSWDIVVGEKLGAHTIPNKLSARSLQILTDHPAFAQNLSFMEEEIKKKIYEHFQQLTGKIDRISFQYRPKDFAAKLPLKEKNKPAQKKLLHPFSPLYKKLESDALKLYADIPDEEMRKTLVSIYIQTMNRE